uniref:GYF domain-containing protein n=1 Tax=Picea sitchensis TaxID=3332 RepID=D5A9G8_PICSI|nr:unknown [Picea sitchensis]
MGWSLPGWLWWKKDEGPRYVQRTEAEREALRRKVELYKLENKLLPDYRYSKKVEEDLQEHPFFDNKDNLTPQEFEKSRKLWEKIEKSEFMKFVAKSDEVSEEDLQREFTRNKYPYRREDDKLWQSLPHVPGPSNGRPMPRKALLGFDDADNKFWDFFKQYHFGLWGCRQRPYPPGRPIDIAQSIGYSNLDMRYYDFAMKSGGWYYKDRLGRTRGPMELITMKTAYAAGIIDTHTFVWGDDMDEWAPIGMIYGLEKAVNTIDVKLAAAGTAFIHKLAKGLPPWMPLKGRQKKTYRQLQDEGIESKEREKAVMRQHGGVWPGEMIPSHALFLWASGTELTSLIESDTMPNKFIPYDLRKDLAKVVPGLRPWEVISLEQTMDLITYNGKWYREVLSSYTTRAEYLPEYNRDVKLLYSYATASVHAFYRKIKEQGIFPIDEVMLEAVRKERELKKKLRNQGINAK